MPDEPAGFEIDAEDAAKLVRREAFFARTNQMHGLKPNVHRNMALLKYRPDLDSKRLAAGVALIDAKPGALALQQSTFPEYAAVWTEAAIFPNDSLDIGVSGGFVAEAGLIEDRIGHMTCPI
jgi:hypothetical protein